MTKLLTLALFVASATVLFVTQTDNKYIIVTLMVIAIANKLK